MKHSLTALALLSGLIGATLPSLSFANVTYTYTGNNFTELQDLSSYGIVTPYNTSMSVSGSFELASALPASLVPSPTWFAITPLAFTFNDGIGSISSNQGDLSVPTFNIATDASGNIVEWSISVARSFPVDGSPTSGLIYRSIFTQFAGSSYGEQDAGSIADMSHSISITGIVSGQHGSWAVTAVPEADTYAMLLTGLGLVGFMARRRNQDEA
jgi:hypothetical protein